MRTPFRPAACRRLGRRAGLQLLNHLGLLPPLDLAAPPERLALRRFWIDGLFLSAGGAFLGSYLSLFLIAMGASGQQVGLMNSLSNLGALLAYLVAARFTAAVGGPKRSALLSSRLVDVLAAPAFILVPILFRSAAAIYVASGLLALRALLQGLGSGAWTIFSGQVTPIRLRGRYFSSRSVIKALMAVILVPVAGRLITACGGYPLGYQVSFALAVPLHLAATTMFARIPEPLATLAAGPREGRLAGVAWWRSGRFLRFIAASATWNLGASVVGPFYTVFMARQLGLGADTIGLLATVSTAATIAGYAFWGPLADRRGAHSVLVSAALASAGLPWLWILVRSPWHIVPIQAVSGFLAGGFGVAHGNRLLEAMPAQDPSAAMGAHLILQGLTGMASSLLGGYLFDRSGLLGPALAGGICLWVAVGLFCRVQPAPAGKGAPAASV